MTGAKVLLVALLLLPAAGCGDKWAAAKERAALLACADHGGVASFSPKLTRLNVVCKDGTGLSVKYLP